MKRIRVPILITKWIANKLGYKIAMIKICNATTSIEGDRELLRYVDIIGYLFKKEPLSYTRPSKAPTTVKEMFLTDPKAYNMVETWEEIYDQYHMDEYPTFGGPFTNAKTFREWLEIYYTPPVRRDRGPEEDELINFVI